MYGVHMGTYGFLWVCMGIYGFLWVSMDIYGYIGCVWVYMA